MGRKWTRYTLDTRSHACRFAQRRVCVYGEEHQELVEGGRRSCSQNRDRDAMSVPALSVRFPPSPSLSFAAGHEPILWKYLPSILNITLELVRLRSGSSSLRISLSSGILISLDEGWTSDEGLLGRVCIYIYIYIARRLVSMEETGIFFQTVILPIRKRSIIGVAIVFWKYYLFIYWIYWIEGFVVIAEFVYYKFIGHIWTSWYIKSNNY